MRLIIIGFTTHETDGREYFETDLTDEQVEDAIVRAAEGISVYDLDDLLNSNEASAAFFARLKELGVIRRELPVDQVFIFDGWALSAPRHGKNDLTVRIAKAVSEIGSLSAPVDQGE